MLTIRDVVFLCLTLVTLFFLWKSFKHDSQIWNWAAAIMVAVAYAARYAG